MKVRVSGWVWALVAALATVELLLLGYSWAASASAHLQRAQAMLRADAPSPTAACQELLDARADLAPLFPVLRLGQVVPFGPTRAWGQVPALADAGEAGCQALRRMAGLLPAGNTTIQGGAGSALLAGLRRDPEAAATIGAYLQRTAEALEQVDAQALQAEDRLKGLAATTAGLQARAPQLSMAAALAPSLPDLASRLLGGDRPRTYLLVGQNNDELRATGGFIGTLGTLTVSDGRVAASDVRSSYLWDDPAVPKLAAPEPLRQYMNFGGWYLRDANWWVDFRRSAAQLVLMWEREHGQTPRIDGVIAVDRVALELLLDAVGGVNVAELGGHVDAETLGAVLDEQRRRAAAALQSYDDYQRVKSEALTAIHGALLRKVTGAGGQDLWKIGGALGRAAQEKHALFWFREEGLQSLVAQVGWDGRVEPGERDFLGIVDTTMSYGKVTPFVVRESAYQRRADGAGVLTLVYRNHYQPTANAAWDPLVDGTWWDWRAGVFRREQGAWLGYVRVLAPAGSHLIESAGWDAEPESSVEGPAAVFGAPVLLRSGDSRTVSLVYSNPTPANEPPRRFKQPGDPNS